MQREEQYNNDTEESFEKYYYYVNTVKGVNKIRSFYFWYEPDFQSIQIHNVNFHRGNKIIRINSKLHVEKEIYEKQIAGDFYANDGRIKIYFEGVKQGDIIEFSYTEKGSQPDLKGSLHYQIFPFKHNLRGTNYIRILNTKPIKTHAINWDPKIIRAKSKGLFSAEFKIETDQKIKYPTVPDWYSAKKKVYFFDKVSWSEYVNLNIENYELAKAPSIAVQEKVKIITKGIESKEEKINAILNYIQEDIHYLDYDLIEPKKSDVVLKQGVGDCKSKSLLTIKMLECLGVTSWPLIVKSDGLDERILNVYSGQIFDHAVVEYELNGKSYIFDATQSPQKGNLKDKTVSDFRYGLRIKEGVNELTKLDWKSNSTVDITTVIYENEDDLQEDQYRINSQVVLQGELANDYNWVYNTYGIEKLFDEISEDVLKNPYRRRENYEKEYFIEDDKPFSVFKFRSKNPTEKFESIHYNSEALSYAPLFLKQWSEIKQLYDEDLGEFFDLPYLEKTNYLLKTKELPWMEFTPDTVKLENDWIKYNKTSWKENDSIYAKYSIGFFKKDLDSSRYKEVVKSMDSIHKNISLILTKEKTIREDYSYEKIYRKQLYTMFTMLFVFLIVLSLLIFFIIKRRKKRKKYLEKLKNEISNLKKQLREKCTLDSEKSE